MALGVTNYLLVMVLYVIPQVKDDFPMVIFESHRYEISEVWF